jgi:hypothetical protein
VKLPHRSYSFYAGCDPGFSGAIALLNRSGTTVRVWPMPVTEKDTDRQREINLDGLRDIFRHLRRMPDCAVGIEWPSTRPGEGAERSERFGRGKGYLEAFAFLHRLDYFKLSPAGWKGRLNLPGKEKDPTSRAAAALWEKLYPERSDLIRGPRGGVLDGPLDALLIAEFLRRQSGAVAEQTKRGSVEHLAAVLAMGPGRRRKTWAGI